jgi:hypothetical protein
MTQVSEPNAKQKWIDYLSRHSLDRLEFPEWAEIMGVGKGKYGLYVIGLSGVHAKGFGNNISHIADPQEQAIMVRINNIAPLTFPFTLQALLDFVEGPAGQVGGIHFTLPDGFREAAADALAQSSMDQAERDIQDTPTSGNSSMTGGLQIVSAGETAKELPAERQARLQERANANRAAGVKAWMKKTADEEGISKSMLDRILRRSRVPAKQKLGTIEALKSIGKRNNR